LSDHDFRRCPIAADPGIICGCTLNTCGKCSAACLVCDEKGHAADTLKENVRRGIVPKWACSLHNMQDIHVRMAPGLKNMGPTQRVRKELARGNKRRLAELVPKDGTRFRTHAAQSEIVDVCGELMKCAASVQLSVPFVLASMRQFIVEMRAGDEDMRRFFKDLDTKLDAPAVSL